MARKRYQEEPSEQQSVRVMFEQLRGEFRVVAESHGMLANGLEDLRKEVHDVGRRVGLLDLRVGELGVRVGELGVRVGEMGQKIDTLTTRFDTHEQAHAN
jgi:hypothetical protein